MVEYYNLQYMHVTNFLAVPFFEWFKMITTENQQSAYAKTKAKLISFG